MSKNTITISEDEITVTTPIKKEPLIILINVLVLAAICGLIGLLAEFDSKVFNRYFIFILIFPFGWFFGTGLIWHFDFYPRTLVFDKKYIVIRDAFIPGAQRIFKMAEISNITLNTRYRLNIWKRLQGFWFKYSGGCIGFRYENKPYKNRLVYISYGLSVEEASSLLNALQEKGWINGFQRDVPVNKIK